MFKFIQDFFQSIQKAAIACHFARMGDYKAAQAIVKE
jgi:hypothetical protein